MSATVLVDLVVVVLLVLAAWSGGRTGAARSAISLIALALGLIISAQGQSDITAFIAHLSVGDAMVPFGMMSLVFLGLLLTSYITFHKLQNAKKS